MEEQNTQEKLSYEKLQAIASGLKQQNDSLVQEMNAMRQYLAQQQTQEIHSYLASCFKAIDNLELYSTEFANTVVADVEKVMMALREYVVPQDNEENDGSAAQTA